MILNEDLDRDEIQDLHTKYHIFETAFEALYGIDAWQRDWYGDRLPKIRAAQRLLAKENADVV